MAEFNLADIQDKAITRGFYLTKFLDFKEQSEINSLNKYPNLQVLFDGGYDASERKRALIIPNTSDNIDDNINNNFEICIIHSLIPNHLKNYNKEINHRHVLGTIMALGIERNTFGDIIIDQNHIYIFCSKAIKDFLINNLTNINNISVQFSEIDCFEYQENNLKCEKINVSSLRVDAILAKVMNKSRNDAQEFIKAGFVLINYDECLDVDKQVKLDDLLSIRHFGRVKVIDVIGVTKKNRLNVLVEVKH